MNRQFSRIGLAAALCSSLFLVGCGDDDDDNDGNPTSPSSPAPVQPSASPSASPTPSPSASPSTTPGGQTSAGQRSSFIGRVKEVTPPTARIGGQQVTINDATVVDRAGVMIGAIDLQRDELVRVRGRIDADGSTIIAEKITVQFDNGGDDNGGGN